MGGGAFLTSREIFDNPIWMNIVEFRLFFLIYGRAVFSEEGARVGNVFLKRGQWVRSIRNLQKDLEHVENRAVKQYSTSHIKRAIDSLVKQNRIEIEVCELGTLFTVVNYQQYQGFERYSNKNLERTENSVGTEMEQGWNNNKNVIKEKKGNKKTSCPKRVYDESSPYMRMAKRFLELIHAWHPEYKFRGNWDTWANDFRLMVEVDGITLERLGEVVKFATSHHFWRKNVLSPAKLRGQWNILTGEMNTANESKGQQHTQNKIPAVQDAQQTLEMLERLNGGGSDESLQRVGGTGDDWLNS